MFSKRNLLLIILRNSAKAILAVILTFVITLVAGGQIDKISKSVIEKKTGSFVLEKRSETTERLRQDLNLIGENETKVENALPSIDNVPDVLAAFESVANETSLHISINLGSPVPYKGNSNFEISSVDYSATLNGNIETLIRFLKSYERLPFLASISSISIVSTPEGWTANSQITIPGRIFVKQNK